MSLNDATPEEWNTASKTAYGKLYHPNDTAIKRQVGGDHYNRYEICLLYTSPSPRDRSLSRMPSSA